MKTSAKLALYTISCYSGLTMRYQILRAQESYPNALAFLASLGRTPANFPAVAFWVFSRLYVDDRPILTKEQLRNACMLEERFLVFDRISECLQNDIAAEYGIQRSSLLMRYCGKVLPGATTYADILGDDFYITDFTQETGEV